MTLYTFAFPQDAATRSNPMDIRSNEQGLSAPPRVPPAMRTLAVHAVAMNSIFIIQRAVCMHVPP